MNFRWKNGLIWVEVEIEYEGQHVRIDNCILDTGSASTAIDIDLVNFNYRKPASIRRLVGVGGGTQEVVSQVIDGLIIDDKTINNINIEFGDLQQELGINGFIGTDILCHFEVSINFPNRTIGLCR